LSNVISVVISDVRELTVYRYDIVRLNNISIEFAGKGKGRTIKNILSKTAVNRTAYGLGITGLYLVDIIRYTGNFISFEHNNVEARVVADNVDVFIAVTLYHNNTSYIIRGECLRILNHYIKPRIVFQG